ncbi:V4R domain-containing protein [Sphingopyxis sp. MSC1_008]|uniref:V4R domain-containing protein n=1 Tax=Sphingopyxis sp. MSC1_008 TaxID=2909265 RepID=UPI0020C012FB|nr:V4R domain-containing protein [Sphingopyxis sp. MSC1_008]
MDQFKDRLQWDVEKGALKDGPVRYVLIRADALMGLFRNLPGVQRREALDALKRSVTKFGGRSARRYDDERGAADPDILTLVAAGAPQLGWGHWTIDRDGNRPQVIVKNSPFARAFCDAGEPVCAPISGMLQAAATIAFGHAVSVQEVHCAAAGAEACMFELEARPDD